MTEQEAMEYIDDLITFREEPTEKDIEALRIALEALAFKQQYVNEYKELKSQRQQIDKY